MFYPYPDLDHLSKELNHIDLRNISYVFWHFRFKIADVNNQMECNHTKIVDILKQFFENVRRGFKLRIIYHISLRKSCTCL